MFILAKTRETGPSVFWRLVVGGRQSVCSVAFCIARHWNFATSTQAWIRHGRQIGGHEAILWFIVMGSSSKLPVLNVWLV